jgi:hypothetical protein
VRLVLGSGVAAKDQISVSLEPDRSWSEGALNMKSAVVFRGVCRSAWWLRTAEPRREPKPWGVLYPDVRFCSGVVGKSCKGVFGLSEMLRVSWSAWVGGNCD